MGINISGNTDIISATDGSLTIQGADFTAIAAGSTAAPSISPTGDSNTGIFFPSADTIAFGANGAEALRITSTGQLRATGASDVRFTLGSTGTPETNNSVHIRADGANLKFMNASGGITLFEQNGVEAARFNTSGNLAFPSGQGIDFSATANSSGTMTSELLDDYEVGTWTPTIAATSSNPTISYTSGEREGSYIKIGKLVHVDFWIRISSCSAQGSGDLRISGLPFSEGSNAFRGQANFERFDFTGATAGSGEHILGEVDGAFIDMRRRANTGSVSVISTGSIPGGVSFAIGAATYTTA